jgi:group I intron endonuclease
MKNGIIPLLIHPQERDTPQMRKTVANKATTLYVITNKINRKRYIGVTCRSLAVRFACHVNDANGSTLKNSALQKAIRKYGKSQFSITALAVYASYQEALTAERAAIAEAKPEYNCTAGGDGVFGYRHTQETRRVLSALKKGRPSPLKGWWTHSDETRRLLSEKLKGKPGHWKGKTLPPHVVEALRRRGIANREAWVANVAVMGSAARKRPVVCLNDSKEYESVSAAASAYSIDTSSVAEVCSQSGIRRTVGNGLVFRYLGEHHGGAAEAALENEKARKSQSRPGQPRFQRAVRCLDDGLEFPCLKKAAAHYRVKACTISRACQDLPEGKRGPKRAHGMRFTFVLET